MSKKGRWAKDCGHSKGESCYNCIHKRSIIDEKSCITVSCSPKWGERTLKFNRNIHPNPFCGAYESNVKAMEAGK